MAATTRLQRLTSTVPAPTKLFVLNSALLTPSPTPSSSITNRRRVAPPADEMIDRTAELALVEEALEYCDEERRRCEDEIRVLRECLGEVGEWCGGVISGIKGFEKDLRKVEEGEDESDIWAEDDVRSVHLCLGWTLLYSLNGSHWLQSLLIPHPQFARPAKSFAPTIHAALHHIRTRIHTVVEATESEIEAARVELAKVLEEEKAARVAAEEERVAVARELREARSFLP